MNKKLLLDAISQDWVLNKKNHVFYDSIYFKKTFKEKLEFVNTIVNNWSFILLDTETTDLNEFGTALPVQISIKVFENWILVDKLEEYINVDVENYYHAPDALKISHITKEILNEKWITLEEFKNKFLNLLTKNSNKYIICHNAKFDKEIINNLFNKVWIKYNEKPKNKFIDSLEIIKVLKNTVFFLSKNKNLTLDKNIVDKFSKNWNNQSILIECISDKDINAFEAHDAWEDTNMLFEIISEIFKLTNYLLSLDLKETDINQNVIEKISSFLQEKSFDEKFISFFKMFLSIKYKNLHIQDKIREKYKNISFSKNNFFKDNTYIVQKIIWYERDVIPEHFYDLAYKLDYSFYFKGEKLDLYSPLLNDKKEIADFYERLFGEKLVIEEIDDFESEYFKNIEKQQTILEILKKLREIILWKFERLELFNLIKIEQEQCINDFKKTLNLLRLKEAIEKETLNITELKVWGEDYFIINKI